jgi:uncharacterized RDD family membrane protein YckC
MNQPPTPQLHAPRLRRRMASWLYEGILLFGVTFLFGYLFSALTQSRHALMNRQPLMAFLFVIFGIYFVWFGHKGQTLAMKTWHLRLVDANGQRVSQSRALFRYILSWVWFLPPLFVVQWFPLTPSEIGLVVVGWVLIWALLSRFHPRKQFWHDALAKTNLVDAAL